MIYGAVVAGGMDYTRAVIVAIILVLIILIYYALKPGGDPLHGAYFDYNGTAPMHPKARQAWQDSLYLGNAHASYAHRARAAEALAKQRFLEAVGAESEETHTVIWTSGGSESNNLILRGLTHTTSKPHYILSATEHKTSLECAKQLVSEGLITLTLLPVLANTYVCPYELARALRPETRLVSLMHVNNESGVINNLAMCGRFIKSYAQEHQTEIFFHTDAVQSLGKLPPNVFECQLDAISFSSHKFGGPLGCGGLIISRALNGRLIPQISGSQNYGLRGGTDNIPGIVASGVALVESLKDRGYKNQELLAKKRYIIEALRERFPIGDYLNYMGYPDTLEVRGQGYELVPLGANDAGTIPNTLWFSIVKRGPLAEHFCNLKLRNELEERGVIISVGSACNANSESHVLDAIKAPYIIRCGVVRISLGDTTSYSQCNKLISNLIRCIEQQ